MYSKWNSIWIGLVAGLILPAVTLFLYYQYFFGYMTIHKFVDFAIAGNIYTHILSLCVIPNAGLFFFLVWKEILLASRGVLLATFVYAFLIFALKFFT